jgi:hypothetical protein
MKRKMSTLVLIARRWWRRGPGTTYHSCEIIVDGNCVHRIELAYGPDQMYEQSATNWLDANGWLPGREKRDGTPGEALWRYCERMGIMLTRSATDVTRKKDL